MLIPITPVSGVHSQFDFDGGRPGAGGDGTLLIDGDVVATGRIDKTCPFLLAAGESMDIGLDGGQTVTDDYAEGPANAFTGTIDWVQIDLEEDEVSHMEDPEQTYHRIMARQ